MADKSRADISPQKRSLKLTPLIGDWTTYKPPRALVKKVKLGLYGFDRLSGEELKAAHLLHYNFALKLCASLKNAIRAGTELYSVEAQQNSYAGFLKNFSSPILQGKVTGTNSHDEVFVSFDLQVIDALINAALGAQDTSKLSRELSEAEEIIIDEVLNEQVQHYFAIMKDALPGLAFERVGSPGITEDPGINGLSTFVHFAIEISVNGNLGKVIFGYNGSFLKDLLKKLRHAKKRDSLQLNKLPNSIFSLVELPVTVSVGKTCLTMPEIRGLEEGDVISFDQNIDSAIAISLSEGHVIYGQPGIKDGKFVVRVVAVEKEKQVKVAPPSYEKEDEPAAEPEEETAAADSLHEEEMSLDEFSKTEDEAVEEDGELEPFGEESFDEEDLGDDGTEASAEEEQLEEENLEEETL